MLEKLVLPKKMGSVLFKLPSYCVPNKKELEDREAEMGGSHSFLV